MKINIDKLYTHLEEIYQCGKQEDGTYSRIAYSKEDVRGREIFMKYFRDLGLEPRVDEVGNIIVRIQGKDPELPAILIGSHLDTVPDGGKYDGALGCTAGLAVCEALIDSGHQLQHSLEVIVFTDEEGVRFGSGMLGSSAFCGIDPQVNENDIDMYGLNRKDVIKSYRIQVSDVHRAARGRDSVHCFIELHIEQGAQLDRNHTAIGVVSTIAGVNRYEVTVTGQANHAGSTAMCDRKDALAAASAFICQVPEIVKKYGKDYTVATVGTIKVTPNSVNVVPGSCTFHLEIRDQDEEVINLIENKAQEHLNQVCCGKVESLTFNRISHHRPEPMTDWVRTVIEDSAKELEFEYKVLPSGAFHDSLMMAQKFPTGMIFVPSVGGISHSRDEFTKKEDIQKGCKVLLQAVLKADNMRNSC